MYYFDREQASTVVTPRKEEKRMKGVDSCQHELETVSNRDVTSLPELKGSSLRPNPDFLC